MPPSNHRNVTFFARKFPPTSVHSLFADFYNYRKGEISPPGLVFGQGFPSASPPGAEQGGSVGPTPAQARPVPAPWLCVSVSVSLFQCVFVYKNVSVSVSVSLCLSVRRYLCIPVCVCVHQ